MFEGVITFYLILLCLFDILVYYTNCYSYKYVKPSNISKYAKMSLVCIGVFDDKVKYSLTQYFYTCMCIAHSKDKLSLDLVESLHQWNTTKNDITVLQGVSKCIEEAYTRVLNVVSDARENERPPMYKIDFSYDLTNLPKSIVYNDLINTDALIEWSRCIINGGTENVK